MTPDDDDERKHAPEHKCPNCGAEFQLDKDTCPNCGFMRTSPSQHQPKVEDLVGRRSAGGKLGAAAIGCAGAFVAAVACLMGYILLAQWQPGPQPGLAIVLCFELALAVLLFLGFRASIGHNPNARPALYAFVIVFVVLFGGFLACVAAASNLRFQ